MKYNARFILMAASLFMITAIFGITAKAQEKTEKRTVYMSYILHGNMNYDRYVRTTLWKDFPIIYGNLLDFMDEHPDFKGQLQFSGQTLNSLKQCAPDVLEHAMKIHRRGQLNFTGTFYSEPVNVNMDGETNFRCALLGTGIIEDFIGAQTDGFYLQERAYHPQLPWILNNSRISWAPVITGDDSWKPFKLSGLDGSTSICVPVTRKDILEKVAIAPANSLITIEEDYEIPQKFSKTYKEAEEFNRTNPDVQIVWITVKEYIDKFGVDPEKFVDHAAKATHLVNGTYSRWTADPLDIIIQEKTNAAMADFRNALMFNALLQNETGATSDKDIQDSDLTLEESPLAWNIERADLYPDVEPKHLARNGKITMLTKAEHLLLWAVNSDSKGWYPLYEKRVERTASLENSSDLSKAVIGNALNQIGKNVRFKGYDRYFIVGNMEQARKQSITISTDRPYTVFNYATGEQLSSICTRGRDGYTVEFMAELPEYGYCTIGMKASDMTSHIKWEPGSAIEAEGISVSADETTVTITQNGQAQEISLAPFMIKALADVVKGENDDRWRDAKQYGQTRISVSNDFHPQLKVDRQIDWLVHCRQTFTIKDGKVVCDIDFNFPHPTVVRRLGEEARSFDPRGLDLIIRSGKACKTVYDIPFGISEYTKAGEGHFCPLSTCIMENAEGGVMVAPQTGEQGFSVNADTGEMTVYLGASTVSGPIKDVRITFRSPVDVFQEPAWYLEPFHGEYRHRIVIDSYKGTWQENHIPARIRANASPVYVRECHAGKVGRKEEMAPSKSFLKCSQPNIDITSADIKDGVLKVMLNEREGKETDVILEAGSISNDIHIKGFGITEEALR